MQPGARRDLGEKVDRPADHAHQRGELAALELLQRGRIVVERLLEETIQIDYPRALLQIQVLDEPDDVTTARFRRMSVMATATSALLHATVAAALLPEQLPRQARVTERAIEVTLDLPTPPKETPAGH